MEQTIEIFETLYKPQSYVDMYFGSIALFVVFHLTLFCLAFFWYIQKIANEIKSNWSQERCKPQIIPFAGLIMQPKDQSMLEFTEENFASCQQGTVQTIFQYLLEPFKAIMGTLMDLFQDLTLAIQALREAYDRLKDMVNQLIKRIMNSIMTILIPFKQMVIVFQDMIGKFNGVLVTTMYVLLAVLDTFKSSIIIFVEGCIAIFVIFVIIIISWFFGVITIPLGIAALVIYLSFSTPFKVILKFTENVLGIKPSKGMPNDPKKPHQAKVCFHPSSIIRKSIKDKRVKDICIKDIRVGDTLENQNDVVTGILILRNDISNKFFSTKSQSAFFTEFHKVWFVDKWVTVKEHPDFQIIDNVEPTDYVYCLLTTSKRIHLEKHCFLDWDEIEDDCIAEIWNDTFSIPKLRNLKNLNHQGIVILGNNNFHIINENLKNYNFYAESFLSEIKKKITNKTKTKKCQKQK